MLCTMRMVLVTVLLLAQSAHARTLRNVLGASMFRRQDEVQTLRLADTGITGVHGDDVLLLTQNFPNLHTIILDGNFITQLPFNIELLDGLRLLSLRECPIPKEEIERAYKALPNTTILTGERGQPATTRSPPLLESLLDL